MVEGWKLLFNKKVEAHTRNLTSAGLAEKAKKVLQSIKEDPFSPSHRFEKLIGDLNGFYSKRINVKHRIVYKIDKANFTVYICSMWSHYQ